MSINIWTDSMQHAALLGKPVLFTNWLIQRDIIPDGWYCYDLRGTHKSPSTRTTLVDHAADYHAGTVLSPIPLKHEGTASRRVNGTFYLLGEEMTLEQFCEEHDLAYPQDNREFVLRPASLDEVGLFYSEEKLDEALGTVGHLRMDFGHGEKEFWHTWWPHNEDRFNTPEFKEVLQRFVDDLRQTGLLKNLGAMDAYVELDERWLFDLAKDPEGRKPTVTWQSYNRSGVLYESYDEMFISLLPRKVENPELKRILRDYFRIRSQKKKVAKSITVYQDAAERFGD